MCIQSYYNNQKDEEEIELDLLGEIKELGIDEWNERVSREKAETESGVEPGDKEE